MKKYLAVWGALFFFVICISLYLMMETVNTSPGRFPDIDRVSQDFDQALQDIDHERVEPLMQISYRI